MSLMRIRQGNEGEFYTHHMILPAKTPRAVQAAAYVYKTISPDLDSLEGNTDSETGGKAIDFASRYSILEEIRL